MCINISEDNWSIVHCGKNTTRRQYNSKSSGENSFIVRWYGFSRSLFIYLFELIE